MPVFRGCEREVSFLGGSSLDFQQSKNVASEVKLYQTVKSLLHFSLNSERDDPCEKSLRHLDSQASCRVFFAFR